MEKSSAKTTPLAESTSRTAEAPQAVGSEPHSLLRLQAAIGNQAVQRLLNDRIIRAKLSVSNPSYALEQSADRIAEHTGQAVSPPEPQIQRKCSCSGGCNACKAQTDDLKVSHPNDASEKKD